VKHRHLLLLIVVVAACSVFSGCSGAVPAQVFHQAEEKEAPIPFINDHATGLESARQEHKPTLAFFSVPDNAGSQRMMETTFCDEEVKRLAERFVCIHVDGSQELLLCQSLEISSFPTIVLFDINGREIRRLIGKQTPDQLAVQMHVVLQATALRPQTSIGR
jgi:thioredoxin-related protein